MARPNFRGINFGAGPKFADAGAFNERGGVIRFTVHPSADRMSYDFLALSEYFEDTLKPLMVAKKIAIEDMHNRFATDTDPDKVPWTSLEEAYAEDKAKAGYDPNDILTRTGKLEKAATDESAWEIRGPVLMFHTGNLPKTKKGYPYWQAHQFGSDPSGQGELRGFTMSLSMAEINKMTAGSTDNNRGKALPQRRFIGLSREARMQIGGAFDLYYEEGINNIFVSKTGVMQERVKGHFGPKLFPRPF